MDGSKKHNVPDWSRLVQFCPIWSKINQKLIQSSPAQLGPLANFLKAKKERKNKKNLPSKTEYAQFK